MPYRAAIIGCGKIGSEFADDPLMRDDVFTHAEAYTRCGETCLAAVCDKDLNRLARCGRRWGVKARYQNVQRLMKSERPDLVSICTPEASHYEVLRQVLTGVRLPRGVLCEKPLATDPEEGKELVELAHRQGVVLAVAYMRRYADNVRALKSFLQGGRLGDIQAVSGWYTKGTLYNGSHWFDLLRFLAGEVKWVLAVDSLKEPGPDPTLDVMLGMENGALGSLRAASADHYTIFEMDILGTLGRVQLTDSCFHIAISLAGPSPRYSGYVELVPAAVDFGGRKNLMLHAVENLAHCVRTGEVPASSGEDGLTALEIGWAAHESARSDRKMVLRG